MAHEPERFSKRKCFISILAACGDDDEGEKYSFSFLEPEKPGLTMRRCGIPCPDIVAILNISKLSQWLFATFSRVPKRR